MGKNSNFERNPRDFYPTPYECILPLLQHLPQRGPVQKATFIEPCAGDGRLIRHLTKHGYSCAYACDIEPKADFIQQRDVLFFEGINPGYFPSADFIITNPPWEREAMHQMISLFRSNRPTWLLIDAGWMFTRQARPHLQFCARIVPIGRVSWMGNGTDGKEDCCWYNFIDKETRTEFCP